MSKVKGPLLCLYEVVPGSHGQHFHSLNKRFCTDLCWFCKGEGHPVRPLVPHLQSCPSIFCFSQTPKLTCCSCPCITSQSKGWETQIFCHEPDHMSISLSYHFAFASGDVTGAHRHLGWVWIRASAPWRQNGGQTRLFRHLIGMPLGWLPCSGHVQLGQALLKTQDSSEGLPYISIWLGRT